MSSQRLESFRDSGVDVFVIDVKVRTHCTASKLVAYVVCKLYELYNQIKNKKNKKKTASPDVYLMQRRARPAPLSLSHCHARTASPFAQHNNVRRHKSTLRTNPALRAQTAQSCGNVVDTLIMLRNTVLFILGWCFIPGDRSYTLHLK